MNQYTPHANEPSAPFIGASDTARRLFEHEPFVVDLAVIEERDLLRRAAALLNAFAAQQKAKAAAASKGQLRRFKKRQTA